MDKEMMNMQDKKVPEKNWLHLDLKGAIPSLDKMLPQLEFWKTCGYDGIVWEYDDRIPWKSWPGTWRGGYTSMEHRKLMHACGQLGLQVIPLIQTLGHLEWLLKHDAYRHLRENDSVSELCPLHPDVRKLLKRWIDEVVSLHPESRFLHLGGDETMHLGTCPKCAVHDKMRLYTDHMSELCAYASAKGLRPLIWADVFLRENRMELASALPKETIPVDWHYDGVPPYPSTAALRRSGLTVMGASGVMCGWWEHCYQVQSAPGPRIRNAAGWYRWAAKHHSGVIHTTWTRGSSLWNIYGPWHGAFPAFLAGGNPERWKCHPWNRFFGKLTRIMERENPVELAEAAAGILELPAGNAVEYEARRWWNLALRYQRMRKLFLIHSSTIDCLEQVGKFVGRDEAMLENSGRAPLDALLPELEQWEHEAEAFWLDNGLSDWKEFRETHSRILKNDIQVCLSKKEGGQIS